MHENEISFLIRKAIFKIYNSLGPGLFESVYVAALVYELQQEGLAVAKEVPLPLVYETIRMEAGFRIDILIEDKVIIEVKSIENLAEVHHKQLITYLKLSGRKLGLLVNFNSSDISKSIFRKVNGLEEDVARKL
jgi:GxxExxY protein